jgi:hypothetical protein
MGILDRLRGTDPVPKQPAKTMVASAVPLNGPGVRAVWRGRSQATTDQWQTEAWYYFDVIGELRGPLIWIANAVSQADVYATEIDPDTGKPTGPTEDARATAAAAQVLGGPAQRMGLLRLIALCWQVPGECWIIVRPTGAGKPDKWLVLSGARVKAKGDSWQYTDPFNGETVTLGGRDRLIRAWSPHPDDQAKADSAIRPALPVCREVEKASQNIAARLDSRLAGNGVWMVPEEVDFPKGDHETVGAALMDMFLTTAEMGLQNPGQASSQVPIVLTVPGELIDKAQFQDFSTAFDASVVELRQDSLKRLAATLDMPNDVAEGTQGESNHWSAWQVEESTYKIYVEPLLKTIGDVLTEHWFRPALLAMGLTPDQAERFELGWDTTAIVARPDDTENLRDLHDRVLISDEYMLTENGVPLDAMPDDDERTRRLLEKWVAGAPTLLADPAVAKALGLEIEVAPVATGVDAAVAPGGELEAPEPAPAQNALPGTQGEEPQPEDVPEGLVAAAELIVYDALSRAGGRLLTNQNRGQFKSTPRHELHTVIEVERSQRDAVLEGSFQFVDRVAEAFDVDADLLAQVLRDYCMTQVVHGEAHNRERMVRMITDRKL